eukprot:TRINITY_DN4695_c0_g1_i1.p1 TRINITY_DN4695_c0_g1~~TRINITY_DN4695_c0_g1_i1.p1  ORF type:complete len:286 (-),score=26.85 TRINITY_DN4695_c0_g1_i1:60-917(-)
MLQTSNISLTPGAEGENEMIHKTSNNPLAPQISNPVTHQNTITDAKEIQINAENDHLPLTKCVSNTSLVFAITLLIGAMGYIGVSVLCALDKRGKDTYFVQNETEADIFTGLAMKLLNPSLTIKTDNWGYFQVAFSDVMANSSSKWKDYDCFLAILGTAGISGIMWIILCSIKIHALRKGWTTYGKKCLILHLLTLLVFLGGNGYIFFRIYTFNNDISKSFELCHCDSFASDYYRSITYYFYGASATALLAISQFVVTIVYCMKTKGVLVSPNDLASQYLSLIHI